MPSPKKTDPEAFTLDSAREHKLDALIGTKLRRYYDDLMAEPVPDRILDLLAALAAREQDGAAEGE